MLADARACLLLAAELTATGARRKRNGVGWQQELRVAAGVAGHAEPQASVWTCVPGEATAAPGPGRVHQPGITGLMHRGTPGNAEAGISRVYVFAVREIRRAIQYCPVRLSDNQCGSVLSSTV